MEILDVPAAVPQVPIIPGDNVVQGVPESVVTPQKLSVPAAQQTFNDRRVLAEAYFN